MKNYFKLLKKIKKNGQKTVVRGYMTSEIIDEKLIISNKTNFYEILGIREKKRYLIGELAWYFSGERNVEFILNYSKFWNRIKNIDGTINSNYGFLTLYSKNNYNLTQFEWCLKQFINDIMTRKAVMLYNKPNYYYITNKDFICTQIQQFIIRNNYLNSIIYIRSSDVIRGLTFDIPWWSIIQQMLYLKLKNFYSDLKLGQLTINFGSVHVYEEHFSLLNKIIKSESKLLNVKLKKIPVLGKNSDWYKENIDKFIEINEI